MRSCLVGVPTLNGPVRLARCLQAIADCTTPGEAVVLVADDGSTPELLQRNKEVVARHGVEMLTSEYGRLGVAAEWNRLSRHAACPVIALVNDDIEVVPDWLDVLRFSVEENPGIGVVSLNTITGAIKSQAPPQVLPDYREAHLMTGGGSLVSAGGACFAMRRETYDLVGGFDERYFCFYEEIDFSVAARRRFGLVPCIASWPLVFHLGGATTSDPRNMDAAKELGESRRRFVEKWGLTPDQFRREFLQLPPSGPFREWNSQLKFLRD